MIEFLANISDILFYLFGLITLVSVSMYIAYNLAKRTVYKKLESEYKNSREELKNHVHKNSFSITFSDEALELHSKAKELNKNITELKGALLWDQ